jgi:hypothetical protein
MYQKVHELLQSQSFEIGTTGDIQIELLNQSSQQLLQGFVCQPDLIAAGRIE